MKFSQQKHLGLATRLATGVIGLSFASIVAATPVAIATFDFDDSTLNANEGGVAALSAIDPLGANTFVSDTVLGTTKAVYRFDGNSLSAQNAGLELNTTGLLSSAAYSVDLVFSLDTDGPSWERILDASNRSSDNGFYIEPGHKLQIFPVGNGPDFWTFGTYHRVTLTNDGSGHVTAYLNGALQFDLTTVVMDFNTYGAANPTSLLTFFADNLVGGGQNEFVDGKVSLIRLYDFELDTTDVVGIDPGTNGTSVPEPGSLALLGLGLAALSARHRRS